MDDYNVQAADEKEHRIQQTQDVTDLSVVLKNKKQKNCRLILPKYYQVLWLKNR